MNANQEAIRLESDSAGEFQRIFVNSMSDSFENHPGLVEQRARMFQIISKLARTNWLLLTKRPENIKELVPSGWLSNWPPHIWIGVTAENQEMANKRIPALLAVPARVRFLSCEPLLGRVDISQNSWLIGKGAGDHVSDPKINWVICGGESGPNARPMHPAWAVNLRDQCQAADIPFFFKQWGEFAPWDPGMIVQRLIQLRSSGAPHIPYIPNGDFRADRGIMTRLGKKDAGRLLHGRDWSEFPNVN